LKGRRRKAIRLNIITQERRQEKQADESRWKETKTRTPRDNRFQRSRDQVEEETIVSSYDNGKVEEGGSIDLEGMMRLHEKKNSEETEIPSSQTFSTP